MPIISVNKILDDVRALGCSDLHFTVGINPVVRLHGQLRKMSSYPEMTDEMIAEIVEQMTNEQQRKKVTQRIDVDFSYVTRAGYRHRCNIFYQRDHLAVAIRLLRNDIPTLDDLFMPPIMSEFAMRPRGLVLITGPTGSGKSTTLAGMIDYVNCNKSAHVITIEDPIEYVHEHKRCMVNQREVGADVPSFAMALRAALREDPDVILVGEMRDFETIQAAITAAETGHLVFSTLHTTSAPDTINRIIDVFPASQQQQVKIQLAQILKGIVAQQLVTDVNGGLVPAFEVLKCTPAVQNMIRDGKLHQLDSVMQTSAAEGMFTMDMYLLKLYREGKISKETALLSCVHYDTMSNKLES